MRGMTVQNKNLTHKRIDPSMPPIHHGEPSAQATRKLTGGRSITEHVENHASIHLGQLRDTDSPKPHVLGLGAECRILQGNTNKTPCCEPRVGN